MKKHHCNSQKRIYFEDGVYFVTLYTKYRLPYFRESMFCDLFVEELRLCKKIKGFKLFAWVVCYEHVHLLFQPSDEYSYSDVMHFLKRHSSRGMNIVIGYTSAPKPHPESADSYPRFQGTGASVQEIDHPRFQGTGDLYGTDNPRFQGTGTSVQKTDVPTQKEIWIQEFLFLEQIFKFRFKLKYLSQKPYHRFRWQKSFIDHITRDDEDFGNHWSYIKNNPSKHGLPDDWPYIFTNPKYNDLIDFIDL